MPKSNPATALSILSQPSPAPRPAKADRLVRGTLYSAQRCDNPWAKTPRGSTPAQRLGLAYERKVQRALGALPGYTLQPNPWFSFTDDNGFGCCSPDALLRASDGSLIVIEIKFTYVPTAISKLRGLYIPVITQAMGIRPVPLVVCKTLTALAPLGGFGISASLALDPPVMQWLGSGKIYP